jgi:hypothetical protein
MDEADVNAAIELWKREAATDLPWETVRRALRALPTPHSYAVSDDGTALLVLAPTDVLFTVSASGGKVTVQSRPLAADRLIVSAEWSGPRETHWTFRRAGEAEPTEPWQTLRGSPDETPDARERFARAIAERAGWNWPAEQQQEEADDTAPREGRWRRQTDVWGRPLRSR